MMVRSHFTEAMCAKQIFVIRASNGMYCRINDCFWCSFFYKIHLQSVCMAV